MKLLLAVDLNDETDEILVQAKTWGGRLAAKLDLVYVDEHSYGANLIQDPAVRVMYEREWRKVREHLEERLRAVREGLPEEMRGEAFVRTGRAFEEIVDAAKDRDAVLIGTHGRRGLSHAVMGSVAERVVRAATVPVLVLRRPPPNP